MKLLNYLLFQAGWLACVIGAAHGALGAGLLAVAAIVAVHLLLAGRPAREAGSGGSGADGVSR